MSLWGKILDRGAGETVGMELLKVIKVTIGILNN